MSEEQIPQVVESQRNGIENREPKEAYRSPYKQEVTGSSPVPPTKLAEQNQHVAVFRHGLKIPKCSQTGFFEDVRRQILVLPSTQDEVLVNRREALTGRRVGLGARETHLWAVPKALSTD